MLAIGAIALLAAQFASATTYTYDSAGRLKSATNSTGQTAIYDYDSRGNLLRIERVATSSLAISSFSPAVGTPGTNVVVNGSGFSATTGSNAVTFNGTSASVLSASTTQLTVQVPVGATSGTIGITVSSTTATSGDSFTVITAGAPPSISSFTPNIGTPGDAITINGSNLYPIAGETLVTVDGMFVPITTIDNSHIVIDIPDFVGSGTISVTTAYGAAATTLPLWVMPSGTVTSTITEGATLTPGGSAQSVVLSGTGSTPAIAFLFNGTAGQFLSLQANSFSDHTHQASYAVYSPEGTQLVAAANLSAYISWSQPSVHLPPLPETGTYTVYISGGSTAPHFSIALEQDSSVTLDGTALAVSSGVAGQSKRIIFGGVQLGDHLGLGLSSLSVSGGSLVNIEVDQPDGSVADANFVETSASCAVSKCIYNLMGAPMAGTYAIVIYPPAATASFNVNATISHTLVVPLPDDSSATTMHLTRQGQNGVYTFSGTAGEHIALQTVVPTTRSIGGRLFNPDTSTLSLSGFGGTDTQTYNYILPQTGTYSLYLWTADGGDPVSFTAALHPITVSAITIGGGSAGVLASFPGQDEYLTFDAFAGENVALGVSSISTSDAGQVAVGILLPDGTWWGGGTWCSPTPAQCSFYMMDAPETGTYTVILDPEFATRTYSVGLTLSDTVQQLLPTDGTPTTLAMSRFGQNGEYTFSGTSGQHFTLQFSVPTPGNNIVIHAVNPDGTDLIPETSIAGGAVYNLTLTHTGTFTIYAWPDNGGIPNNITAILATPVTGTSFVDTIGHTMTAHGSPKVVNVPSKFGAPSGTDASFSSVKMLMHFEQSGASASSGSFPSGAARYITTPNSADFAVGSGDFTWEGWVYPMFNTGDYQGLFSKRTTGTAYAPFIFGIYGDGLFAYMSSAGTAWDVNYTAGSGMALNTWHHVMFSRVSGTLYMGFDGNIVGSTSASFTAMTNTANLAIGAMGADADYPFAGGYIDDVRFTKGVGRYSGTTYTVPTAPFADH